MAGGVGAPDHPPPPPVDKHIPGRLAANHQPPLVCHRGAAERHGVARARRAASPSKGLARESLGFCLVGAPLDDPVVAPSEQQ